MLSIAGEPDIAVAAENIAELRVADTAVPAGTEGCTMMVAGTEECTAHTAVPADTEECTVPDSHTSEYKQSTKAESSKETTRKNSSESGAQACFEDSKKARREIHRESLLLRVRKGFRTVG